MKRLNGQKLSIHFKSFFIGMGSNLNLFGDFYHFDSQDNKNSSMIQDSFQKVGNDFRKVLTENFKN